MDTELIIKNLHTIASVPDIQIKEYLSNSQIKCIAKKEYFIREGEIPSTFAFVIKGLFRYYYINEKGVEFTKGFFPEQSFISSYSAMIQNRESYFTVEALEDSEILTTSYSSWKRLLEQDACWKNLLIALLEKGYCVKESREREFLLFDAETRYKTFLSTYPLLEKRIPQHMIASYLGITPVALSRTRKKMGIINPG